MKKCFKCGEEKERSEFYKHKQMADGLLGKCKECAKKDANGHRAENIDKVRAYDRNRSKRPHRRKNASEYHKKYGQLFPLRRKAQSLVCNAIRTNKYIKPELCQVCSKERRLEGHHDDYSKPLDLVWLCVPCHRKYHLGINDKADQVRVKVKELLSKEP